MKTTDKNRTLIFTFTATLIHQIIIIYGQKHKVQVTAKRNTA